MDKNSIDVNDAKVHLSTDRPGESVGRGFREAYILHLADNSLIMGHRLSEWTGHGPMLEQDIAMSNIALDLIGQSRNFYQYSARLINQNKNVLKALTFGDSMAIGTSDVTEDSLAYLRNATGFKNILLVELPNGDWAKTILKLFFFSTYQYFLYEQLIKSSDEQLSAIAEKSIKEVIYHVRWSSEWVIRLGDGTEESHKRLQNALDELYNYVGEMFVASEYENECAKINIGTDVSKLKNDWKKKVNDIFFEATLSFSHEDEQKVKRAGKQGLHTEHLQNILTEMQHLQRTYPGCEW
jgi:ring-1,2-phenylacetyl-CoA epoxidase subunit PaaC